MYYFLLKFQCLLLFLGLAASVSLETYACPSSEDIYPCKCDFNTESSLECKNETMSLKELKSVLSYFTGKKVFQITLENLVLGTVPSRLFEGIEVKHLVFSDCEIDSFQDGERALIGLEDSIFSLKILSSFTQRNIPLRLKIGHLKKLLSLTLKDNKITELYDYWLDSVPSSIFLLSLNNNVIEKVGDKAFEKFTNLEYFTLSGNKFGTLKRSMLPSAANRLRRINLSNNDLEILPKDLFNSMPSLLSITLSENKIQTLDQEAWEIILEQLESIGLDGNPLQCDSGMHWLFDMRVAHNLYGTCYGPEGKKGLSLKKFLENRND